MATPTILVDSATGSDSAASGAGPATALTGTNASFTGTPSVVTLDGSPDLSGVDTTGLHCLYIVTSTGRRFSKITAVDNSLKKVTVEDTLAGTATGRTWAIGGKRASLGSVSSLLLVDQGGTNGDWKPGWVIEFQSGHTETITGPIDLRQTSDTTSGLISIRGASGAVTLPIITFNNDSNGFTVRVLDNTGGNGGGGLEFSDFELRNSNASKTASVAISTGSGGSWSARRLKIDHATNYFWKGLNNGAGGLNMVESCRIGNTVSNGVQADSGSTSVVNCEIFSCGGIGLLLNAQQGLIYGNIIRNCTGDGVNLANGGGGYVGGLSFISNTITGNGGDGVETTDSSTRLLAGLTVMNNTFDNNGGYGWRWHSATTTIILRVRPTIFINNNHYLNTSGLSNLSGFDEGTVNLDPTYTSTGGGDYSIGTNLKAKGHPLGGTVPVGKYGSTYSYVDIGAAQRQEPAATGGGVFVRRKKVR